MKLGSFIRAPLGTAPGLGSVPSLRESGDHVSVLGKSTSVPQLNSCSLITAGCYSSNISVIQLFSYYQPRSSTCFSRTKTAPLEIMLLGKNVSWRWVV